MVTTFLLCILAILILGVLAISVSWPVVLAVVAGILTYKLVRDLIKKNKK